MGEVRYRVAYAANNYYTGVDGADKRTKKFFLLLFQVGGDRPEGVNVVLHSVVVVHLHHAELLPHCLCHLGQLLYACAINLKGFTSAPYLHP